LIGLASIGFVAVVYYHEINGLFFKDVGDCMLNPRGCPSTSEKASLTSNRAELEIVNKAVSADGFSLKISILATNRG
jgi:hypothetical protein